MSGQHNDAAGSWSSPDLAALRREYGAVGLGEADAHPDPWVQWERWFADAVAAPVHEPNAMVVATVDPDGRPSVRTVLLKGASGEGFRFFTNTASRKGEALAAHPACSLLFPWHPLERQVRVEGSAELLPADAVAAYWATRPRGARLGAWASRQSQVVADRAALEAAYEEAETRFDGREVPVPSDWGGYLVRPTSYEFWQGRRGRLHDRLRYVRTSTGWEIERLAP